MGNAPGIEAVIAAQTALIAALDGGDVAEIEAQTAALSQKLTAFRAAEAHDPSRIDHALRQADAARTRVNFLADRTRQRIERLAAHRGIAVTTVYDGNGSIAAGRR